MAYFRNNKLSAQNIFSVFITPWELHNVSSFNAKAIEHLVTLPREMGENDNWSNENWSKENWSLQKIVEKLLKKLKTPTQRISQIITKRKRKVRLLNSKSQGESEREGEGEGEDEGEGEG